MPKRMIRDWTDSEKVNGLTVHAERLFVRLIMKADDFGRFTANPKLVRAFCFPLLLESIREADVARSLNEIEKAGLIVLYESAGKPLLCIKDFGQRLKRESIPKFPPPPGVVDPVPKAEWRQKRLSDDFPDVPGTSGNFPPEARSEKREARSGSLSLSSNSKTRKPDGHPRRPGEREIELTPEQLKEVSL